MSFNTRARTRRARIDVRAINHNSAFQHTCPREAGTCGISPTSTAYVAFQHTCPREAGTQVDWLAGLWRRVSTHVPARGGAHCGGVSTHVPARGGHMAVPVMRWIGESFNSRARARRAPLRVASLSNIRLFQHTCPREAGTRGCWGIIGAGRFQHTCPREAGTRPSRAHHHHEPFQHTCPREAGTKILHRFSAI